MSESVFEKLLGSYSGMRKRTWAPSIIKEAALSDEQKKAQPAIQAAFTQAAGGTPVMGQGTRRNINFEPVQDRPGSVKISGSNIPPKILDQTGFNNTFGKIKSSYHPTSFAYKVFTAWAPQEEGEKKGDEKSKETQPETEPTQQLPGFTKTQRDGIAEYIEQKEDTDPTLAQRAVQAIQKTIITPLSRTKLATLLKERPDLTPKIQSQLLDLTSRFFSMAGKVEKATLADGTEVTFIRGERLSAGDRTAGRVITVRGNQGTGGVSFGRANGETVEEYEEIQTYARAYDHKTYGFKLGSSVDQYGPNLHNARILPAGVDVTSMTKEEFQSLDTAVRRSISSTDKEPIDDNDTIGKLFEDIIQIGGAIKSGNAKDKAAALKEMRNRLEKLKELGNIDLLNFAAPLMSGEVDDIKALLEGAPNLSAALKSKIKMMDRQLSVMERVIGLKSVKRSERPSQGSKIGFRTDNRYVVSNEDPLNSKYADVMNPNEEGDYRLEISAKQINSPTATTALGTNKVENALGKDTAEYDKLHGEHLERAVDSGSITEQQAQACRDALEHDRGVYGDLVKMFGDLTKPNKQALASYYDSLIAEAPGQFEDSKTQLKYVNYLKGLKQDLKKKDVNPRQAAMKLLQLHRIKKAATDRDYAAGMFYNDAVLSMGSFENELLMRGSPVDVALMKTHQLANDYAKSAFSEDFDIEVGLASVSLKKDKTLIASNRVAGKENKQFVENQLANGGKRIFADIHSLDEPEVVRDA